MYGGYSGESAKPPPKSKTPPTSNPPFTSKHVSVGETQHDVELQSTVTDLSRRLDALQEASIEERQRLLRDLFREWHPDKRLGEERLATKVFQWLQHIKEDYERR